MDEKGKNEFNLLSNSKVQLVVFQDIKWLKNLIKIEKTGIISFKMAQADQMAAQFPVYHGQKCELCETNHVMFQCINCDELMCETCQKSHLKSKASKNHKTVCLISPEMYKINQTGKKCRSHTEEDLIMYCNTCNCPICRECISSGVHPNHSMVKVEEVIDTKQQELSNIIRLTNEKSQRYKDILRTITRNKMQFSESIAKTIKEIKARNKQLKDRLDKIESEYIKQLENKDKENKIAMTELEQRIQKEMSDLNQLIQQCERKRIERNIEMVQFVTDVMQRVDKYTICNQQDDINPPNLITRDVDDQELKDLFGHLDLKTKPEVMQSLLQIHRNVPPSFPTRVVTTGNDQAWLWKCGGSRLSLVTSDGKIVQNIRTDFKVFDAAVSTSGKLFVKKEDGNKIKKITRDNRITDIYTARDNYITRGITVTDTGNVLVVLYKYKDGMIVDITTNGQHIRIIQHDPVDNIQLFDQPKQICTNINGEILVTDDAKVVAVNKQGQKRLIYPEGWKQLKNIFDPEYIVTDKHGHIIISDFDNSVVHVLDSDGKFIQYLITPEQGCDRPIGLDLDNHGRLWMCNYGKREIDIIKYL
ncbi:hypothetical protein KUTeg_011439 [Tegillarca granosa]|uniref:B box-type domain-containing protein n=1 Tax=Tegillarca granosa TaxID=220873 RepID=A0ABQ9F0X4_TEGGR|nr:hypothetical protein KUTeg_011439 [Tegillarca granosa]